MGLRFEEILLGHPLPPMQEYLYQILSNDLDVDNPAGRLGM